MKQKSLRVFMIILVLIILVFIIVCISFIWGWKKCDNVSDIVSRGIVSDVNNCLLDWEEEAELETPMEHVGTEAEKTDNEEIIIGEIFENSNDINQTGDKTDISPENKESLKQPTQQEETHTHKWAKQTETIAHKEQGHYETKVIHEAYDEEVYAWRTFCNKCGEDITDTDVITHSAILCESGYHNDYVVVDTVHHGAETKQVWVVDVYGYTETITSWKCECGAIQ